jgi:hypothetical protein
MAEIFISLFVALIRFYLLDSRLMFHGLMLTWIVLWDGPLGGMHRLSQAAAVKHFMSIGSQGAPLIFSAEKF